MVTSCGNVKEFLRELKAGESFHGFSEISFSTPRTVAQGIMTEAVAALEQAEDLRLTWTDFNTLSMQDPGLTSQNIHTWRCLSTAPKVKATEQNGWNAVMCRRLNEHIERNRNKLGTRLIRLMVQEVLSEQLSWRIGRRMCENLPQSPTAHELSMHWTSTYVDADAAEYWVRLATPWTFADWVRRRDLILSQLTVGDLQGLNSARQDHQDKACKLSGDKLHRECRLFVQTPKQQFRLAEELIPVRPPTEADVERMKSRKLFELSETSAAEGLARIVELENNLPSRPRRASSYVRGLEDCIQTVKTILEKMANISLPSDEKCRIAAEEEAERIHKWYARQFGLGLCIGDGGFGAETLRALRDRHFFNDDGSVSSDYVAILHNDQNAAAFARALKEDWQKRRLSRQKYSGRSSRADGRAKAQSKSKSSAKRTSTNGSTPAPASASKPNSSKRRRYSKSKSSGKSNKSKKKSGVTCYNCNKPGHMRRECPELGL